MKKKHLKLDQLTINSFVTNLKDSDKNTIDGGVRHAASPYAINLKDTSAIDTCTPHGSGLGCPFNSWDVCGTDGIICWVGQKLFK